jgi:eukaryotic-like serine/threonine-protein kinase
VGASVLGRFALEDRIGAGGSGVVWRARDRRTRQEVAVKIVAAHAAPLRLALRHPHLLTPYAQVADETTVGHAMRLVRGGTADRLLAEHGALPDDYVAVLLDQLLGALGALHDVGVVHQDVKPANLLLEPTASERPHLWLSDLDLAARAGVPDPDETEPAGTPGYVAPERRAGSPPDPRHDLYAAGVTATELLTGSPTGTHRGPLRSLLVALTAADAVRRPAGAADARTLLRAIGVPEGAPWQRRPHPPDVPDRFRGRTRHRQ